MPDWMFQISIFAFLFLFAMQLENIRLSIKRQFERREPQSARSGTAHNLKDEHA